MTQPAYHILLYYCYTPIDNAPAFADQHLAYCKSLGLKGRIIVAEEGLNGTVSGTPEQCRQYMDYIHADARFAKTDFKIDESDTMAFDKNACSL